MKNNVPKWVDTKFNDLPEIIFKENDKVSINFKAIDEDKYDKVTISVAAKEVAG